MVQKDWLLCVPSRSLCSLLFGSSAEIPRMYIRLEEKNLEGYNSQRNDQLVA